MDMRDEKTTKLIKLLKSYTYIQFEIDCINENIINLGEVINSQRDLNVPELTGMPRGNETSDTVYNSVEKIIVTYGQEVARFETRLEKAFEKKNNIEDLIKVLDPLEKQVIILKYFKKYKNWMICSKLNYSSRQIDRFNDRAIKKLLEVYEI
jgi:DNA-directed RNA polymerase specialized sigma subunit